MRPRSALRITALAGVAFLASAGTALADAVTHWNSIAQAAIATGRPGPVGMLDSALVQGAVYDAVQSIERKFKPYHIAVEGAHGSPAAAAGAAAYRVLLGMYGATQSATLNAAWAAFLDANPDLMGDPGIDVGEEVAAAFLLLRRATPNPEPTFAGGTGPGEWRPTPNFIGNPPPPTPASMVAPWVGAVTPFTLISGDQFRAAPPPRMTSRRYLRDYNEVKALGSFANAPCQDCGRFEEVSRTPEQTTLAYFWSENFGAQWNRALRAIAEGHLLKIADSSRLFALANMAAADAFITAWDSKVHYNFWRPLTAIREGDMDGNPDTFRDAAWQSLINNPQYPDYTSGANNVTGAMTRSLRLFFGKDKVDFTVTHLAATPQLGLLVPLDPRRTRIYKRFSQAADEVVEARILLGIHFRFADAVARRQGERVAEWAFKHFLRPVKHRSHHGHHGDGDDCDRN